MDMLRVFFEISDEDTSKYFSDKEIWKCGDTYRMHQGKYPVIFLTFKDVKFDSWDATLDKIGSLLQTEYGRHQELLESERVAAYEKEYFTRVLGGNASEVDLTSALEKLSQMLTEYYEKAPIIIIDEYFNAFIRYSSMLIFIVTPLIIKTSVLSFDFIKNKLFILFFTLFFILILT